MGLELQFFEHNEIKTRKQNWAFGLLSRFVLLLIVASYFSVQRLPGLDAVFVFDLLLLIYIFVSMVSVFLSCGSFKVYRITAKIILFLNIVLLPSLILLPFTNDLMASIGFIIQYYFIFIVLPLFINYLLINRQLYFFMSITFLSFLIIGFIYIVIFFNPSIVWSDLFYSDSSEEVFFGLRFFLGEFTPNEMGHYFVMFVLSSVFFVRHFLFLTWPVVIFTFIFTLSKTVWIQVISYFLFASNSINRFLFVLIFSITFIFILLANPSFIHNIVADFSADTSSNQTRIEMFKDSVEYIPYSIFQPAFHSDANLIVKDVQVTSAHNAFLSFINNFGMLSFVILITGLTISLMLNLRSKNKIFLWLIIIDLIVLLFNPLINARHVWLPLFILFFLFYLFSKPFKNINIGDLVD